MAYSLNGKVVLITGAASGIGLCVVKCLLEQDVKHVAILDIAEDAGITLQNELNKQYEESKITFIKCDVTDKGRLLEAFEIVKERHGYIDVVINGAAILDDSLELYEVAININLIALITSSLQAWNAMHKEKSGTGGTLINISSTTALFQYQSIPIYSATKSAVLKFSSLLGGDLYYPTSGVRVLTICFGLTNTPMLNNLEKVFDKSALGRSAEDLKELKIQSPEAAANAVIEVYKQGASGSIWVSTSDRPVANITETYDKSYELFEDYVYN